MRLRILVGLTQWGVVMAIRRVSKQGLSGCPACGQHVKLDAVWRETVCPFCETPIVKPAKARAFPGRGGIIAASLLSVGLVGCDSEDPEPSKDAGSSADGGGGMGGGMGGMGGGAEPEPQPAPEPAPQPLYGEPDPQPAPEPAGMPEYGIPPEPDPNPEPPSDAGVDAAIDMAIAPDAGPMPEYGTPPVEPDGGEVPLYGIPPMQDAGVAPDAAPADAGSTDMADPMPVPLYGIPPERE